MEILRTFFDLLTPRDRRNLYLLFVAVVIMAGLEVVSVASIMPFLSVAADPASVQENVYLSWVYETLGFTDTNTFLIALGLAALVAMVLSNAFIIFTTWALYRYAWGRNHTLSYRLLKSYLHRPYEYFLTRNSSELGKNILEEVKEVVNGMLVPGLMGTICSPAEPLAAQSKKSKQVLNAKWVSCTSKRLAPLYRVIGRHGTSRQIYNYDHSRKTDNYNA